MYIEVILRGTLHLVQSHPIVSKIYELVLNPRQSMSSLSLSPGLFYSIFG